MKATRATLKSFINKNKDNLLVSIKSSFDGMVDCVMSSGDKAFYPANVGEFEKHTYGVKGVWIVGGGRDYITPFESNGLKGYDVYNCCGSFAVAVKA